MCSPFLIYSALAGACKGSIAQCMRLNKGSGGERIFYLAVIIYIVSEWVKKR